MTNPGASTSMDVEESVLKERDAEIEKLIKITELIIGELGDELVNKIMADTAKDLFDLDISDEVSGFLMTVFTCLRKKENDKAGHLRFLEYDATIGNVPVTVKSVVGKIEAAGIALNFLVATPIVEIMTLFRGFFDEVRTGVTKFRVRDSVAKRGLKRKVDGKATGQRQKTENMQNISQYGLTNQHISLLQGITLPPERRTGIIRSLGPLTQALLLVMEDKYYDKLKSALGNSIQMLPMSAEIIIALKEASHPGNVSGVLKELGDILLLTTARSTQKMYLPLLFFIRLWKQKGTYNWSFAGANALKLYSEYYKVKGVRFVMKSGGDALQTSEVVFHAMFGTYLENLNILAQITTKQKWHIRKELNPVFVQRGSKPKIEFTPVYFKYVSKMAQALLTKSLGNVDPMSVSRPSFAGFRRRNFTQEFLAYLTTGKSALNYTSEPTQLQYALKKLKDELSNEKEKLMLAGTTEWEMLQGNGTWITSTFIAEEGGSFFYGNNN